ncbi:hypothetical protein HG537_0G01930 [Torulaspora globosa]|uniref:Sir4 SID domain-containing protein n=1 Tax=Torulaspora globosa TaxID=48254 RepID=A0A7H9HXJ6_9SACH|nr:hypothetical protein HG537_0G01930 [Torulaspora sp. CBS 2947]
MQNDSGSSSGNSSPGSRASPISAHTIPLLSKLPAAEQSRVSDGPSLQDNRTPPPRQIPLLRFTPTSESWKRKSTSASPSGSSRPALGIVPLSKDPSKKKKTMSVEKVPAPAEIPKSRLLNLLRSKSKVGNFHNVTLNKADMQQLSRSSNTVPEFISVNQSARVRSAPSEKVAKRASEGVSTNLGELAHEKLTPYEVFTKSRTFTSSIKNLLQGDISNQTAKQAPDAKVRKVFSTNGPGTAQRNDAMEKPLAAEEKTQLPSEIKDANRKIEPSVIKKRTFDVAMPQDQQPAADVASSNKHPKVLPHDTAGAKDRKHDADIVLINEDYKALQNDRVVAKDQKRDADIASTNKDSEALRSDVVTAEKQQRKADAMSTTKDFNAPRSDVGTTEKQQPKVDAASTNKDSKVPRSDVVTAEKQQTKVDATSLNKNAEVRRRDLDANKEQYPDANTVSSKNSKSQTHGKVMHFAKTPSIASMLNNEGDYNVTDKSRPNENNKGLPTAVSHTRTLPTDNSKSTETLVHEVPPESSERRNSVGKQKKEQVNKENNAFEPMHPINGKKNIDSGPLMGIAEKWNNALLQEPANSSSQRQALADLFTKLYQNNMLIKSENTHSTDGRAVSPSRLDGDRRREHIVDARIVTDIGLLTSEEISDERPNITHRQKPHHLRGAVVIQDTASPKLAAGQQLEEDKSLFYLTESEDTLSDDEAPSGSVRPARQESPKAHSSVQRPVSHATLHENSSVGHPISAGKDSLLQDPEVERRRIDRELAIKVTAEFDEKAWFNKSTVMNLVEPGIAKHSSMASHPKVSVTNNICSTENYEHSHAYYYQQLHKRSKLEFIPLRGPVAAEFGKRGKPSPSKVLVSSSRTENRPGEMWKRNWRALLQTRSILFDFGPAPSSQKSDDLHSKQIAQLRRIFDSEFGTKIASQLNGDVEIIISGDSIKATKAVESILNDPVRASNLNKNLRVWSIEKAYHFLENMGINLKKWTSGASVTPESVPKATGQVPISNILATDTREAEGVSATVKEGEVNESVVKEPIAKKPISKQQVAEKPIAERPVAKERVAKEPTSKQQVAEKPIAERPVAKEPVAKAPVTKALDAKAPVAKEPVIKGPISKETAAKEPVAKEPTFKEPAAERPVAKEPVARERIAREPISKQQVVEETTAERPVARGPITKWSITKGPVSKEPISKQVAKRPIAEIPVTKEPTIKDAREPDAINTIAEEVKELPTKESKKPFVRVFSANMAPLTKAFTAQPSKAQLGVNRILRTTTKAHDTTTATPNTPEQTAITETVTHKEPLHEITPTPANELQQRKKSIAEIVDVDIGKTDSETESDALQEDLNSILQKASNQLDNKDNQIKAAQKLILALCQDIMKKELEITSLHGKLNDTERQLKEKDKSIQDYTEALIQRELQLRKISKRKRDLANR